jgi:hypothetical protein
LLYLQPTRILTLGLISVCLIKVNIFLVGSDVPIDSEVLVVTLSISRPDSPVQSFRGAHRGRMYVRAFIGLSLCACR